MKKVGHKNNVNYVSNKTFYTFVIIITIVLFSIALFNISHAYITGNVISTSSQGHGADEFGEGTIANTLSISEGNVNIEGNTNITGDLTVGEIIIFEFGEIIDNIVDEWLKITGNLNVVGDLNVVGNVIAPEPRADNQLATKKYRDGLSIKCNDWTGERTIGTYTGSVHGSCSGCCEGGLSCTGSCKYRDNFELRAVCDSGRVTSMNLVASDADCICVNGGCSSGW